MLSKIWSASRFFGASSLGTWLRSVISEEYLIIAVFRADEGDC